MGNAVAVLVVSVIAVVVVHTTVGRLFSRPVRWWAEAAVCSAVGAFAVYVWGAWQMYTPDVEETCVLVHHQPWDPAYGRESLIPLSKKCNASFDLVPPHVNTAVVVLLIVTAVSVPLALRAAAAKRADADRTPTNEER
ncbi:hypothetical protein AB0G02_23935 [Actinosynnema sp. NPDC023658]|uniref:hypothetical protein n=1 Tax=Actinosynnema sp. NPDC023658 TaxID=3155465 RepID=UPI0033E4D153